MKKPEEECLESSEEAFAQALVRETKRRQKIQNRRVGPRIGR